MSSSETIYAARIAYPQYLEREREQIVTLPIYSAGSVSVPTSGTYELKASSGEVLASGAVTIPVDVAQFTVTAAMLPERLTLGYGFVELWSLLMPDGTTRTFRRDAVLVYRALYPVLTDADIDGVYSDLARMRATSLSSWETFRVEAWKRILGRLEEQGNLPHLILTPWSLRESHLELTLALIMLDQRRGDSERMSFLANYHKREFELGWGRLNFRWADPETDSSTDSSVAAEAVLFGNIPPATSWGDL